MYGLGVNRLGATNTSNDILRLFANGEQGAWYDPSDLSKVFQQDGTTPTIPWTSGDILDANRVGKLVDKSGNGNDAFQTTLSKCPALKYVGGLYYLEFDGVDDCLRVGTDVDFTSTDEMSVFAGARKENDAVDVVVEFSDNIGGSTAAFRLNAVDSNRWRYTSKGTSLVNATANNYTPPVTSVLTGLSKISSPVVTVRVDGVEKASPTNSQGTGNYGSHPINVGSRNNGAGLQLDGNIYNLIIRGTLSNADEISSTETYVASKTGVTI